MHATGVALGDTVGVPVCVTLRVALGVMEGDAWNESVGVGVGVTEAPEHAYCKILWLLVSAMYPTPAVEKTTPEG